jgi:hypothetical protein
MGLDKSTEDWPMFLDATAGLYNMTVGGEYTPDVAEQLQVRAKKLGEDHIYRSVFISSDP